MKHLLAALIATLLLAPLAAAQDAVVHKRDYDVSGLNEGLVPDRLTCDLHFHLTEQGNITWETVLQRLPKLREIFAPTGIQFRIASARLIEIPAEWHTQTPARGTPPSAERTSFYATPSDMKPLAPATARVFRAVIGDEGPGAAKSVHFISLKNVQTGWWERDDAGDWRFETAATSACSFPPYAFGQSMPARVRGAITISSRGISSRTFAHELGHKLINVSHEGVGRGPKGEQWGADDLMIYGRGTRIPAGAEGRFQRERVRRSPFLYRIVAGKREYNPPYREGGHYWDPIYQNPEGQPLWAEPVPQRLSRAREGSASPQRPAPPQSPGLKGSLEDAKPGPR